MGFVVIGVVLQLFASSLEDNQVFYCAFFDVFIGFKLPTIILVFLFDLMAPVIDCIHILYSTLVTVL